MQPPRPRKEREEGRHSTTRASWPLRTWDRGLLPRRDCGVDNWPTTPLCGLGSSTTRTNTIHDNISRAALPPRQVITPTALLFLLTYSNALRHFNSNNYQSRKLLYPRLVSPVRHNSHSAAVTTLTSQTNPAQFNDIWQVRSWATPQDQFYKQSRSPWKLYSYNRNFLVHHLLIRAITV